MFLVISLFWILFLLNVLVFFVVSLLWNLFLLNVVVFFSCLLKNIVRYKKKQRNNPTKQKPRKGTKKKTKKQSWSIYGRDAPRYYEPNFAHRCSRIVFIIFLGTLTRFLVGCFFCVFVFFAPYTVFWFEIMFCWMSLCFIDFHCFEICFCWMYWCFWLLHCFGFLLLNVLVFLVISLFQNLFLLNVLVFFVISRLWNSFLLKVLVFFGCLLKNIVGYKKNDPTKQKPCKGTKKTKKNLEHLWQRCAEVLGAKFRP